MRDKIKDEEYFEKKYNFHLYRYKKEFKEIKEEFEKLKDNHPYKKIEKALGGYYYGIFLSGFDAFYSGYSLGKDIEEIKSIGEGLLYGLYKNFKYDIVCFEDIRATLIFIIEKTGKDINFLPEITKQKMYETIEEDEFKQFVEKELS